MAWDLLRHEGFTPERDKSAIASLKQPVPLTEGPHLPLRLETVARSTSSTCGNPRPTSTPSDDLIPILTELGASSESDGGHVHDVIIGHRPDRHYPRRRWVQPEKGKAASESWGMKWVPLVSSKRRRSFRRQIRQVAGRDGPWDSLMRS